MFKVSQSKVNTFRLCRQKYFYKYDLGLEQKRKARPLKFGGIVHTMLEDHAEGRDPFASLDQIAKENKRLFIEEQEYYGDIVQDVRYIMTAYFEYWKKDPLVYIKKNKRATEHLIEVPITEDILFKGRLDGIAKSKGLRWLVEHKSHRNFPNDDHRWRNVQSSVYIPMIKAHGWGEVDGTLWNYIRSKSPSRPQLLKDGTLSNRQLDSLPQVVIDTIKQHKLKINDYVSLIDAQVANLKTYFMRIYTPIKSRVIKQVMNDFITTAREMMEEPKPVRNLGRHCDWCEFEPLCRASLQGNDEEFIMEKEYVRTVDEPEEDETE